MKKVVFIFTVVLLLLCSFSAKSQIEDLEKWTQEEMDKTVAWLYDNFKNFDKECFLAGTLVDNNGHYQTFTANKSSDEINDKVKWLFRKDLKFIPDTMRRQRITTYGRNEILALFITALFKNDYSDLRALRVCSFYPFLRHYGSEVKSTADPVDAVYNHTTGYDVELLSLSLAKTVAGYYNFDYENVLAVSSGGDIGYPGIIKREKIATDTQKMSFLAGVFLRYEFFRNLDESIRYSIPIQNSLSMAKECVDILKEFGCDIITDIPGKTVVFDASDKVRNLISMVHDLHVKTLNVMIAF